MCSTHNISDQKQEFDDSGCVQDDPMQSSKQRISLLDFSDDVLLCIFQYCTPRDLKALGYSCARLGLLVRERALWRQVDARSEACSRARLKWFIDNTLHADTQVLMLSGYAKLADGCIGLINMPRKEAEQERKSCEQRHEPVLTSNAAMCEAIHEIPIPLIMDRVERHPARFFISAQRSSLPRHRCFPSWPEEGEGARRGPQQCVGPQFTISQALMRQLSAKCPQLTTLALEYCNIDCSVTCVSTFPKNLRKLSLRGSKCFNQTIDKSFLFKIQDYLPLLQALDVSECEWMDPASLLPLSKMPALEVLVMQDCYKLAEFVAYASLTARYGFRVLKSLDLRGSPVGDSEVSALGWLPHLEKLWLSARRVKRPRPHAHYADDERAEHAQLHSWEADEPEYFKSTSSPDPVEDASPDNSFTSTQSEMIDVLLVAEPNAGDRAEARIIPVPRNLAPEPVNNHPEPLINDLEPPIIAPDPQIPEREETDNNDIKRNLENENGEQLKLDGEPPCKRRKVDEKEEEKKCNENNEPSGSKDNRPSGSAGEFGYNPNDNYKVKVKEYKIQVENKILIKKDALPEGIQDQEVINMLPPDVRFNLVNELANLDEARNEIRINIDERPEEIIDIREGSLGREILKNRERRRAANAGNPPKNEGERDNAENNPGVEPQRDGPVYRAPSCLVDCIKIDQLIDVSEARCGRQNEVIVIASSSRPPQLRPMADKANAANSAPNQGCVHIALNRPNDAERNEGNQEAEENANEKKENDGKDKDKDENKDTGDKKKPHDAKPGRSNEEGVNEGASTSKDNPNPKEWKEKYVVFRKNKEPIYVNWSPEEMPQREPQREPQGEPEREPQREPQREAQREPQRESRRESRRDPQRDPKERKAQRDPEREQRREARRERQREQPVQYQIEPRHHVLYVGVGPQLNTYRFPRDSSDLIRHLNFRPTHVDSSSLVTDFAMRRFGRADGEDVNIIHIGPNGPMLVGHGSGSRPDRSSLRFLSVTGYRNITDRSLVHLVTAAPHLTFIDFSGTSVTESGAETFRSLRPDCDVIVSPIEKEEK